MILARALRMLFRPSRWPDRDRPNSRALDCLGRARALVGERAARGPLDLLAKPCHKGSSRAPAGLEALMPGEAVLETEDLTKEFAGFVAVGGVSLRIARDTIHALIGPNGAGKTTCFNLLTKFLSPTRG